MPLPTDRDVSVEDRISINGPRELVFDYFWNPKLWVKVAPHVLRIQILEETTSFQKFQMTIRSADGEHHTVSERIAAPPERIFYRQIQPPELLERHIGTWEFQEEGGTTQVTLQHCARINPSKCSLRWPGLERGEILAKVAALLRQNGHSTLQGLKAEIERR